MDADDRPRQAGHVPNRRADPPGIALYQHRPQRPFRPRREMRGDMRGQSPRQRHFLQHPAIPRRQHRRHLPPQALPPPPPPPAPPPRHHTQQLAPPPHPRPRPPPPPPPP